jgi:DNA invertase Pin-like site-specific DNA recombinase
MVSGRLSWRERAIGHLLTMTARAGDVLLCAEVSSMARSTLQVLEILEHCMQRGVHVHIAKQRMVLDGSMPSRITATVLGLAAEIEREFIALRTREALAKRKAEGKPLGRPKGKPAARLKLDAQETLIRSYLAKGINKLAIAKLVECSPTTLYAWLARRHLRPRPNAAVAPGPVESMRDGRTCRLGE